MTRRFVNRPPGSNWGDFGPDDERGRMNLITPERRRAAVAEVKEGLAFALSLPLDYPGGAVLNPRRFPPKLYASARPTGPAYNFENRRIDPRHTDVGNDDRVSLHLQYSSQWDALAHIGTVFDADGDGEPEVVYYNGWRGHEHIKGVPDPENGEGPTGDEAWTHYEGVSAERLGIDKMATTAVQGRGVMVDLHAHFGRAHKDVGYDDLMRVMEADGVTVETGDMLVFHTGFGGVILEQAKRPREEVLHGSCTALDGQDEKLKQWIADSGVAALCADNYAVERVPPRDNPSQDPHAAMGIHELCLVKLGIHLGEIWWLGELAQWLRANNRNRFLLTAPPLRLPGAVGSPVTPVATV